MRTQLVLCSTLFSTVVAAAAIEAGLLGDPDRRILLEATSSTAQELVTLPSRTAGAARILGAFHDVRSLNELTAPLNPKAFVPQAAAQPVWERLLRSHWGLGDDQIELVVELPATHPAQWLSGIFVGAPVTVISDGLMSYGPTRTRIPLTIAQRIDQLVHVDLVPGLRPVLLREWAVPARVIPSENVVKVFADLADGIRAASPASPLWCPSEATALVLGQYLADLDLVTHAEEAELQADMVRTAARHGATRVIFSPHPSASPDAIGPVSAAAHAVGVELVVPAGPVPAEVIVAALAPVVVVAAFSTGLVTARGLYDAPIAAVGTQTLLSRLSPYANSNRVPLTIIDALTRPDQPYADVRHLQRLVEAVAHGMQPGLLAELGPTADAFWSAAPASERTRYGRQRSLDRRDRVWRHARRGLAAVSASPVLAPLERASRDGAARRALSRWARR